MRFHGHLIGAMTLAIAMMSVATVNAANALSAATDANAASAAGVANEHAHHHAAPTPSTTRTTAYYAIPDVRLTRQDGTVVNLGDELNDGRPVVLSFIYTSCTSVCPLVSHTLAQLQSKLGENAGRVHLVSITIDPEQDDPARLRGYAKTFNAGPEWQHYTGTLAASQAVQRAFNVYRGNKMEHVPATLIRPALDAPWIRIEGFATADQMLAELSDLSQLHAAR
jgi:protein SCO1/2